MMMKRALPVLCLIAAVGLPARPTPAHAEERTISFAEGQWDAAAWTPLRLPMQTQVRTFVQRPDCVGTDSFTEEDIGQGLDNVLLVTDSGLDEGEFEVVFRIGPERGAAPGVFLSPTLAGQELEAGIAVFVADYTMAVWLVGTDPETRATQYDHLVRLARWQDPSAQHVLRCRYSKARGMVALQVDDSDVVVLRFPDYELNSQMGIWGCHGTCDFYRVTIRPEGTLPWSGAPAE